MLRSIAKKIHINQLLNILMFRRETELQILLICNVTGIRCVHFIEQVAPLNLTTINATAHLTTSAAL